MKPIAAIAALALSAAASAADHAPTPELNDVGDNTWVLVDRGGVTSPLGIMAYSSGWYDPEAHRFCLFGGGHFNYSGNEVWCFDIAKLEWERLYDADAVTDPAYTGAPQRGYENFDNDRYPGALFEPAGEPVGTARPFARHTYDALEYVDGLGAVVWGGFAWGDGDSAWCTRCPDTWAFDFPSRQWTYLYDGRNPAPNESPGVGASAWSRGDGLLYAKVLTETWTYDPAANRWKRIRTRGNPPWTIEGTMEYDPLHQVLYFYGGNYDPNTSLWRFDIGKRSWKKLAPGGEGPGTGTTSGPGLAYDTVNDVLAVYFGGTIWIYDPAGNRWEKERPELHPSDADYVFGRFRYDPVNNGFWLHVPEGGEHATWFYRYRNRRE